jgi:nitrite reductase/ring-hydroxylating ferredoxin subunit
MSALEGIPGLKRTSRPSAGTVLCRLDDIPSPGAKGFEFSSGDTPFRAFVVRRGAELYGYIDICPHAGWPLAMRDERRLTRDGQFLICTGHGALFRIEDGGCVAGPCEARTLQPWAVAVRDGAVVVT